MKPLTSNDTFPEARKAEAARSPLRVIEGRAPADAAAEVRALADELLSVEKQRWAYEIHDGLTQVVAAAILQLEMAAHRVRTNPEAVEADLTNAAAEMRAAMADIRRVLFDLSDGSSDETDTPTERVQACVDDVAGRWDLDTRLTIEGDLLTAPPQILAAGQAVIHEALTNAAKHASVGGADVTVRATKQELKVCVEDRGKGLAGGARFGMRMMQRRVSETGGTLEVNSSGNGTNVTARFPIGA